MAKMIIKLRTFLATLEDEGHPVPTLTELAKEVGVSRPQMYRIASGKVDNLSLATLAGIISTMRRRGFKMDIGDLLEYREA
jgi:DNA-binding Xre family transcriptional regulator